MINLSWYASPAGSGGGGGGGGATDLDGLNDVVITSVATGDVLYYNGSTWLNAPASWYRTSTQALVADKLGAGAVAYGAYAIDAQQSHNYNTYRAQSDYSVIFGDSVSIDTNSPYAVAFAQNTTIETAGHCFVQGYGHTIDNGGYSTVFGENNEVTNSNYSTVFGNQNEAINAEGGVAIGVANTATALNSSARGRGSYAYVRGQDAFSNDNGVTSELGSGSPNFRGDFQRSTVMYKGYIQDSGGTGFFGLTLGNDVNSPENFQMRENRSYVFDIQLVGTRKKLYPASTSANQIAIWKRVGAFCTAVGDSIETHNEDFSTKDDGANGLGLTIQCNVDVTGGQLALFIFQNNLWLLPGALDDESSVGYLWNAKVDILESPSFEVMPIP